MKTVTLADVARRASQDRQFYEELVSNSAAALAKADLGLSEQDQRTLRAALTADTVLLEVNAQALFRAIHRIDDRDWPWMGWPWDLKRK